MKYETLFIMVRVAVHADHTSITDIVSEIESHSKLSLTDTANVNILETEIILSIIRNPKNTNHGTQHSLQRADRKTQLFLNKRESMA